jgi:enterochelin esterase-like enzyme
MQPTKFLRYLPLACALGLVMMTSTLRSQQGDGKAKAKGNNLIQPLAALRQELKGKLEKITLHGKSLEGNLEGDSPDRDVFVYLPPGYAQGNRRYPVVYTLHGYGLHAEQWVGFANVAGLERAIAAGKAKEMILVAADSFTLHNGSFYSNSRGTGDWERFIAVELVNHIDKNYRTIANRASRGIMGHSMGGYGTFRIGMKFPEVFSSMYPMSAAGMIETAEVSPAITAMEAIKTKEDALKLNFNQKSPLARAAAWSPNPDNPPLFIDLPVKDGKPVAYVQGKWMANSLLVMMEQYGANLKKYKIAMNVGTEEPLLGPNRDMDLALTKAGIAHTFETFPGDHNGWVPRNFEEKVLPFFSENLVFGK